MAFNLLPSNWFSQKRNGISVRHEEDEHPVHSLHREMNRVFDEFFRSWEEPMSASALSPFSSFDYSSVVPRIDVKDTEKELQISAELPGMAEKDIDVSISKDALTISGEKRQETEDNVKGWYRMERKYGSFKRTIHLPCEVDHDQCNAVFTNGVLRITLQKIPHTPPSMKTIPINKD